MSTPHQHTRSSSNHHPNPEHRDRRRSIRLLRDEMEYERNEERRFLLAEELEELEAEAEELDFDNLRATRH